MSTRVLRGFSTLGGSEISTGRLPHDLEEGRLAALGRYDVLDSSPEEAFDGIAEMAADLLGTPVALISLIDRDRQWLKARVGCDISETPRNVAFCDHAIRQPNAIMVVPDASQDPRFASNPFVTAEQGIRFYAGAPLVTPDGFALGTVCVSSPEPRLEGLSPQIQRRLQHLSTMAMAALELRLKVQLAEKSAARAEARRVMEERLRLAFDVADACAWELDPVSRQSLWDPAARRLLGVPENLSFEDALATVIHPDDLTRVRAAMDAALDPKGSGHYTVEHRGVPDCRSSTSPTRWLQSRGQTYFRGGSPVPKAVRMVCVTMDITERRAAAERQALMVAELNHRVKNTLAVVLAISQLTQHSGDQRTSLRSSPERRRFHSDFQARLQALARAHDVLTRGNWCGAALDDVITSVFAPFKMGGNTPAQLKINGPIVQLASEPAVALAMVLHELATNAVKHGALSAPDGLVSVSWVTNNPLGELKLVWVETRCAEVSPPQRRGFGSRMIEATVRHQLGGTATSTWLPQGLTCEISVPVIRISSRD